MDFRLILMVLRAVLILTHLPDSRAKIQVEPPSKFLLFFSIFFRLLRLFVWRFVHKAPSALAQEEARWTRAIFRSQIASESVTLGLW